MNISELGLQPQFVVIPILLASFSAVAILFGLIWPIGRIQRKRTRPVYKRDGMWNQTPTGETETYVSDWYDGEWSVVGAAIATILALIMAITWPLIAIPENPKYWAAYSVTGTVQNVSNTGDNAVLYDGCYTFQLGTKDVLQTCDDRITSLSGRHVEFRCIKNWQYQANDYWTCDIRTQLSD